MEENTEILKPIYIEQVFKNKSPKLAKYIPGFLFSWLRKVICQDQINDFISKYGDKMGVDFADAVIEYLDLTINIEGGRNLPPQNGRYIFVANHPLGGPDGIALISFLGNIYKEVKFPVNDILLNLKNVNNIFLPVNKHGRLSREAVKEIEKAYASDAQMIMFPAGLCSRRVKGEIKDLTWQKNFITEAVKHQRDIVPIHIDGRNSYAFYRLATWRKRLGIKANLEMIRLPKETFRKRGASLTLTIGKPIKWTNLDKSRRPQEWAEMIKNELYALKA